MQTTRKIKFYANRGAKPVRARPREVKFIRITQTKPRAKGRIIAVFRAYLTADLFLSSDPSVQGQKAHGSSDQ